MENFCFPGLSWMVSQLGTRVFSNKGPISRQRRDSLPGLMFPLFVRKEWNRQSNCFEGFRTASTVLRLLAIFFSCKNKPWWEMETSIRMTHQELKPLPSLFHVPLLQPGRATSWMWTKQMSSKGRRMSEYLCMYRRGNLVLFSYSISLLLRWILHNRK